jgi:hypothetical protein
MDRFFAFDSRSFCLDAPTLLVIRRVTGSLPLTTGFRSLFLPRPGICLPGPPRDAEL